MTRAGTRQAGTGLRQARHLGHMNQAIAALVRRHDPDRFLTALFAPPEKRDALLTLYAFNHELARAREVVSEPPLALIRLQWWREVVEGAHRRHEVADPLRAAIEAGAARSRATCCALIDAREAEAEPHSKPRRTGATICSAVPAVWRLRRRVCSVRPTRRGFGRSVPPMASPVCSAAFRARSSRALPVAPGRAGRAWTDARGRRRGACRGVRTVLGNSPTKD